VGNQRGQRKGKNIENWKIRVFLGHNTKAKGKRKKKIFLACYLTNRRWDKSRRKGREEHNDVSLKTRAEGETNAKDLGKLGKQRKLELSE